MSEHTAYDAVTSLAHGLRARGVLPDQHVAPQAVVSAALGELDHLQAVADEPVGLSAEQEIRARALAEANALVASCVDVRGNSAVEETSHLIDAADRLAGYIRDGVRVSAEERSDDKSDLGGSE